MSDLAVPEAALPAIPDDLMVGLEDVVASDLQMPRLKIVMDEAVFEDSLTKEKHPTLEVVLLGLIKQRILWPDTVGSEDNVPPLCKSNDHATGRPGEEFPWEASGFDAASLGENPELNCGACALQEWGTHPSRDMPWCAEQHTYALMLPTDERTPPGGGRDGAFMPALMTLQRSSLKPSKAYLSGFERARRPLFTARTALGLSPERRGTVKYAVPTFVKGEPTDPDDYAYFADQYRSIRAFVSATRAPEPAASSTPVDVTSAPAAQAAEAPASDPADVPF